MGLASPSASKRVSCRGAGADLPTEEKGSCSRPPTPDRVTAPRAADSLAGEGSYKMHGRAPTYAILQEASDRAKAIGAKDNEQRAVAGVPVDALVNLAEGGKAA